MCLQTKLYLVKGFFVILTVALSNPGKEISVCKFCLESSCREKENKKNYYTSESIHNAECALLNRFSVKRSSRLRSPSVGWFFVPLFGRYISCLVESLRCAALFGELDHTHVFLPQASSAQLGYHIAAWFFLTTIRMLCCGVFLLLLLGIINCSNNH